MKLSGNMGMGTWELRHWKEVVEVGGTWSENIFRTPLLFYNN